MLDFFFLDSIQLGALAVCLSSVSIPSFISSAMLCVMLVLCLCICELGLFLFYTLWWLIPLLFFSFLDKWLLDMAVGLLNTAYILVYIVTRYHTYLT